MKVTIGKYVDWFGPYQLAELLQYVGFSEDLTDKIGSYLNKTWVRRFLEWADSKRKQRIKVVIHPYDTYSLDITLAHVIYPALLELKKQKTGVPAVDQKDLPKPMRFKKGEFDSDLDYPYDKMVEQWDWIFDQILFAFEAYNADGLDIPEDVKARRIDKGLYLFGKYYRSLWI